MAQSKKRTFFVAKRTALSKVLKQLGASIVNKRHRRNCPCELTLINDLVSFNVPGATFGMKVETEGTAKASFELEIFRQVINSFKLKELKVEIEEGNIIVDKFSFKAITTFFEDDKILRSIVLPMNYSDIDLVSISASNRYTIEELKFNKLWILVNQAERRLKNNLNAAARSLEPYGISRQEIEDLLDKKIQIKVNSTINSFNIQKKMQDNQH